jgi:AbrB family looped-hinge helix DNA binding protein
MWLTFGAIVMETVTLSSKGQLVIPSHVRAAAHLHAGDTFEVRYLDGEIRLKPVAPGKTTTLDEVAGCLANLSNLATPTHKPLSDAQMHAAIKARLKAEDTATMSRPVKSKKSTA